MFAISSHKLNSSKDKASHYNRTTMDKYASNQAEKDSTDLVKVDDYSLPDGSIYTGYMKNGKEEALIKHGKGL
jgi:hypothetical protein